MEKLGLNQIRERFLSFFEKKEHLRMESFPLVPQNDAGLLLINSGMAPLKPYFTGAEEPPKRRVTTCQKCIRTPDIENVGKTARHGTFFEMLGNFSFGDYFKKEATKWAWEFITEDMKIPTDKLWVSIYLDDDEAFEIWTKNVGVPSDRIVRMGKKDNFWEIGTGPCGPCSEIYFDRGLENGCGSDDCKVGCDCDRYIEFWNLVFTQFNKDEEGNYTPLAKPNIDTGMGLERLACIMQGVKNLFEVDTVQNILKSVLEIANVEYLKDNKTDVSIRVITDHIRSTVMMVADGVIPQNEGRGYVLRRLLRRAARHGRLLGIKETFLYNIAEVVISESKDAYPDLEVRKIYIKKVIKEEEEKFARSIENGLVLLSSYLEKIKSEEIKILNGKIVFDLHSTYGFPIDLTREIAEEQGISIDEVGFRKEMEDDKKRSNEARKNKNAGWDDNLFSKLDKDLKTNFVGYDEYKSDSVIKYLIKSSEIVNLIQEGDEAAIIIDKTPFYAESGGQIGDCGLIYSNEGVFEVKETIKTQDGKYIHLGEMKSGIIEVNIKVVAKIDEKNRFSIAKNHTTTHLLHKALKNIVDSEIKQAGSMVSSDRLRFDFNLSSPIQLDLLKKVEDEVNEKIMESIDVVSREMPIEEAKKLGATALFGEKYGNFVRVVSVGDYSVEFCGGTHLKNTSQANLVKIISESGVAAGVRRIEALTGKAALSYFKEKENVLANISEVLKSSQSEIVNKAKGTIVNIKNLEKEVQTLRTKMISNNIDELINKKESVNDVNLIAVNISEDYGDQSMDNLRNISDIIKNKLKSGVVILVAKENEKLNLIVTATKDVIKLGIHSGNIIKELAKIAGGGGGGRPDMAQAGCKDITKINDIIKATTNVVKSQVK